MKDELWLDYEVDENGVVLFGCPRTRRPSGEADFVKWDLDEPVTLEQLEAELAGNESRHD